MCTNPMRNVRLPGGKAARTPQSHESLQGESLSEEQFFDDLQKFRNENCPRKKHEKPHKTLFSEAADFRKSLARMAARAGIEPATK
jgi:hypothetical protein